jgi:amino acid transporter
MVELELGWDTTGTAKPSCGVKEKMNRQESSGWSDSGQTAAPAKAVGPTQTVTMTDTIALIVGIVVGVGIFKTPSLVAAHTGGNGLFFLVWIVGGVVSLTGVLCYAELATTYPHAGGDYYYLSRAFGKKVGFLFAWARMTIIQPGSIAMLAFIFGDYMAQLWPAGQYTSSLYAVLSIVVLTLLSALGTQKGTRTQNLLTAVKVAGVLSIVIAGVMWAAPSTPPVSSGPPQEAAFGLAMIFVLLSFGGWNEAAYISAEIFEIRRNMVRALLWSLGIIVAIHLLVSYAYVRGLGLAEMSQSDAVAADLMRRIFGEGGAKFVSSLIAISAVGALNATIFTGARTNYAVGQDFPLLGFLGRWHGRANAPTNALFFQGTVALVLVMLGTFTRDGFVTMVDYTAPVFWFFFLLAGVSLFVLRSRNPSAHRHFQVPLYPITPLFFCAACVYILQSSILYTGIGAFAGLVVLFVGAVFLAFTHRRNGNGNGSEGVK